MDISFMTVLRRFILFISCLISSQISAQAGLVGVDLQIHHVQGQVYMIQRPGGWRKHWCANRRRRCVSC